MTAAEAFDSSGCRHTGLLSLWFCFYAAELPVDGAVFVSPKGSMKDS